MGAEEGRAYPEPITRYWIKKWPDGRVTPQFKPDTGEEILWGLENSGMIGLLFSPLTPEFAAKVQKSGNFAIPSRLPLVDIDLDPSEIVEVKRLKMITEGSCYHCKHCKHLFDWQNPTPPDPVCPKCGTKNHWYCLDHGQIDEPIFRKREMFKPGAVEVNCPRCTDPTGLQRSTDLEIVPRPLEFRVKYSVRVEDRLELQFDESNFKVLRTCPNHHTTSTS